MQEHQPNGNAGAQNVSAAGGATGNAQAATGSDPTTNALTYGAVGVVIALVEASLIPGMIIGAALALAPKWIPNLGETLRPVVKGTVRGAYKLAQKTREVIAEAGEQVQDLMAEARLEEAEAAKAAADQARKV